MSLTDELRATISKVETTYASRKGAKVRTAEENAQMPVYIRLTKAEVEHLENHLWADGTLKKDVVLSPKILAAYVKLIFGKLGVDFTKAPAVLARPVSKRS